uniref:HU family DNA-binding protein n=1 Tax=Prevotella sp. TaxID=59823 RepID=UPI004025983A
MNRSSMSILARILAEKNNMTISEAEAFIKQMFDVANGVMQADKQLKIRWLGTFKVTSVKDRESVDVNTGERIIIGGRDKITFTPDNILKEIVNKPFAQFETVVVNDGVDFSEIDRKFAFEAKEEVSAPSDEQQIAEESETSPVDKAESIPAVAEMSDESELKEDVVYGVTVQVEDLSVVSEEAEVPVSEIKEKEQLLADAQESEQPVSKVREPELPDAVNLSEQSVAEVKEPEQPVVKEVLVQSVTASSVQEETVVSRPETRAPVSQTKQAVPVGNPENTVEEDDEESSSDRKHYFMLPRYVISVAVILMLLLIGGIGWFAFNYGKMQAQRNHLALQLEEMQKVRMAKDSLAQAQKDDLRTKALQDSARLAQSAEVLNGVDEQNAAAQSDSLRKAVAAKEIVSKQQTEVAKQKALKEAKQKVEVQAASKYDADPRVRTGAYRILGVDHSIVAKSGQTLSSISKLYLGPGMECYLEAVNGGAIDVKAGQKIHIPKLALKKKNKL